MGLIVVTIKHLLFALQQPILLGWGEMSHLTDSYMRKIIF